MASPAAAPRTDSRDPEHLLTARGPALNREVAKYTREELRAMFADDPWRANYLVNIREFLSGESVLTTYPWNISIPVADICNARCPFCTSWFQGTRCLLLEEVDRFAMVLRHAKLVCLGGHGEPLVHPQFEELGHRLTELLDPRSEAYIITNGLLLDRTMDILVRFNKGFNISLNAATAATHHEVMQLGANALPRIVEATRRLVHLRDTEDSRIDISLSFVVIQQNVHELAPYIALGNELRVNRLYVRTLAPQAGLGAGLNYHVLPPYLHPDFEAHVAAGQAAAASSTVPIIGDFASLRMPVFPADVERTIRETPPPVIPISQIIRDQSLRPSPKAERVLLKGRPLPPSSDAPPDPMENIYNRSARYTCNAPYQNLYLNDFDFRLTPCCYMTQVPGFEKTYYDGTFDFFEVWNSPAMVELRTRLRAGPLLGPCLRCPPVY